MTTQGDITPRAVSPLTSPPVLNGQPYLRRTYATGSYLARNLNNEFERIPVQDFVNNYQINTYINNRRQKFCDIHTETLEKYDIDPITYEKYEPDTEVVSMSCSHYFEHTALFNWFVRSQELKCPTCRRNDNALVEQNIEEEINRPQFVWRIDPITGIGYHSYEFTN